MPIRVLPSLLVNQIAAGEVIERPASVVKELVENSIDAGATQIDIVTEAGGRDLIEVRDDGHGIGADELALALAPHATSKISTAADLDAIVTMGFRGEALASIASVAQVRLRSRPRPGGGVDRSALDGTPGTAPGTAPGDAGEGAEISAEGDRIEPVRPAASPPGTLISVRNLFFNVPARRKFLRTDATESLRIAETVQAIALAHPQVGFRLRQDGRVVLDVPADSSPRRRAVEVIGRAHDAELLDIPEATPERDTTQRGSWVRVGGVVGTPALARSNGRAIRLFVNGRSIADRSLAHAVREAYRGLIDPSRHPTAAVFIAIDPEMVDVNVHPTKAEVRFRSGNSIHGAVLRAVRSALRGADLVPELKPDAFAPPKGGGASDANSGRVGHSGPGERGGDVDRGTFGDGAPRQRATAPWAGSSSHFPLAGVRDAIAAAARASAAALESTSGGEIGAERTLPVGVSAVSVLQVHRRYLVVEDEHGLLVVDQHALHERLMFERISERLRSGALPTQHLLAPVMVSADRSRRERLEECESLFRRLGIEATDAGAAGIAVHSFPVLLLERRVAVEPFVGSILDRAASGDLQTDEEAALAAVVSMMACKASVRSGDRLPPEEIADLLAQRERIERSTACPHGRPTTMRLSLKELDRHFGRT